MKLSPIQININEINLKFKISDNGFSPESIDKGILAMLSLADLKQGDKVLDLGCGYGVVGIYAAKIAGPENVVMTVIDDAAI